MVFKLLAFLLRYGPKSIDEILNKSVAWNMELAEAIGNIMREEGLTTGDS